jgi:hypothetical protein
MSTIIPDLVVGSVGFGSNFADNTASLEAQVRELIRSNNRLIRVINRCVKPSNEVANEAHDAIEEATGIR